MCTELKKLLKCSLNMIIMIFLYHGYRQYQYIVTHYVRMYVQAKYVTLCHYISKPSLPHIIGFVNTCMHKSTFHFLIKP